MIAAHDAREAMQHPAFWDDARMWCLLHHMPWLQLNGSRACGVPYLKYLRKHSPGPEEQHSIKAVRTIFDHVKATRPPGVRDVLAQASRNYTTALCARHGLLTAKTTPLLAAGTVTPEVARGIAALYQHVLQHLTDFDDGGDLFAFMAWVKNPACWRSLLR